MISREEVLNLAELARLKLTDVEVESLQKDISDILEYVGQVSAVSLKNSLGNSEEKTVLRNIMREDAPRLTDDVLANKEEGLRAVFPRREGDYNVVRKIIQKDE